jgi:DNA-binding NtrC family response regulator
VKRAEGRKSGDVASEGQPLRELEKRAILRALEHTGGNRTKAAESLGISIRTLRNKLKEYAVEVAEPAGV